VRNDITIRIAGEGGEGVISTAEILTRAAVDSGLDVFTFRSYPAEIKGGLAMMQVRMSTDPLASIGAGADVLMAFNQEAIDVWGGRMNSGGILLYDPKHGAVPADYPYAYLAVPLHETAMKETGARIAKNIVALASMVNVLGIPPQFARELIVKQFKRKGEEVIATNLKAFDAGLAALNGDPRLQAMKLARPATATKQEGRIIISGNQSLSMGAVAGGCRFVAGYPITPATQVLEFMMKHLPAFGGNVIQCEDEIAAISACLGASWAGTKAMTASSGPGLCLMSEMIGMASMCEIPVVIADVMRSGPATGMPTKTEQADLMYAIHGSAGESPRIVIAATSVEDCFYTAVRAFNLAERYQMPVIMLSDQSMGYRTKTMDRPSADHLTIENRTRADEAGLEDFKRFADTDSGVSPTVVPGMDGGANFVTTGLEHDEWGHANYSPENRARMVTKRYRKLETLRHELEANGDGVFDAPGGAEIGIIGWGSTEGTIAEVVGQLRSEGVPVAHYHPRVLNPMPSETVKKFIAPLKKVIVLEENHTGQLAQHLRATVDFSNTELVRVNQCSGLPFTPDEVRAAIAAHA
jgi:2-oxoglutarate ferredoxin oxidoreductase subunit alpha